MSRSKEHRPNGAAAEGGRPIGGAAEGGASVFFVSAHLSFYLMNIYGYSLFIPYIFHIYIYIYALKIFHIFSFVCFVMYSANRFKSNFLIWEVVCQISTWKSDAVECLGGA